MNAETWQALLALAQRDQEGALRARVAALTAELLSRAPHAELDEPYGRELVYQTDQGEVMLAGWAAEGRSAPHDHGGAHGFVIVVAGRFSETSYRFDGRELWPLAGRELAAGDVLRSAPGVIHDMQARERGLTLHLYFPAIHAMRVYDRLARATVRVTGACGAWLPREAALVLERRFWDAEARASET